MAAKITRGPPIKASDLYNELQHSPSQLFVVDVVDDGVRQEAAFGLQIARSILAGNRSAADWAGVTLQLPAAAGAGSPALTVVLCFADATQAGAEAESTVDDFARAVDVGMRVSALAGSVGDWDEHLEVEDYAAGVAAVARASLAGASSDGNANSGGVGAPSDNGPSEVPVQALHQTFVVRLLEEGLVEFVDRYPWVCHGVSANPEERLAAEARHPLVLLPGNGSLFLADGLTASTTAARLGATHTVSLAVDRLDFGGDVDTLWLPTRDHNNAQLPLRQAIRFLGDALDAVNPPKSVSEQAARAAGLALSAPVVDDSLPSPRVVVACTSGTSVGPAIATAYLMRLRRLDHLVAYLYVRQRLPTAAINPGFMQQLHEFYDNAYVAPAFELDVTMAALKHAAADECIIFRNAKNAGKAADKVEQQNGDPEAGGLSPLEPGQVNELGLLGSALAVTKGAPLVLPPRLINAVFHVFTAWPPQACFPLLDLIRCVVWMPAGLRVIDPTSLPEIDLQAEIPWHGQSGGDDLLALVMGRVLGGGSEDGMKAAGPSTAMMAVRVLANAISLPPARTLVGHRFLDMIDIGHRALGVWHEKKGVRTAVGALAINAAVFLATEPAVCGPETFASVTALAVGLCSGEDDPTVLGRGLRALSTLGLMAVRAEARGDGELAALLFEPGSGVVDAIDWGAMDTDPVVRQTALALHAYRGGAD